ncbi:hypothetical protein BDZ89DRAFT_1057519 [Hymenopellis radicata]|nr:hypothetical protein BDZ89DRAFT_1057519 [Hymenopellis radicata]
MSGNYWQSCISADCPCPNHRIPMHTSPPLDSMLDNNPAFHHLTRTNNVPSPAEDNTIQGMILDFESRYMAAGSNADKLRALQSDFAAKMLQINTQLQVLEEERTRLSQCIADRRRLLAPSRRIPSEILTHIFSLTIDFPAEEFSMEAPDREILWQFDAKESPLWTMELVCKRWRKEVLESPKLWSFINIFITNDHFADDDDRYLLRLALHLSRAGLSQLSICICDQSDHASSSFKDQLPSCIPILLMPFATRIEELYFMLPLTMLAECRACTLRVLNTCFDDVEDGVFPTLEVFDMAPCLETLETFDIETPLQTLPIQWDRITRYTSGHFFKPSRALLYGGPSPPHIVEILRQATHLQELVVILENPFDTFLNGDVTCCHLASLTMLSHPDTTDSNARPISEVLNRTTFPNLCRLRLKKSGSQEVVDGARSLDGPLDGPETFHAVADCVSRSRCPLSTFIYDNGEILHEDLSNILHLTPTLADLRLTNIGASQITNELLNELFVRENGETLVPLLRTFYISGLLQFDGDVFAGMVQSRWSSAPLHEIGICWFVDNNEEGDWEKNELEQQVVTNHLQAYTSKGLLLLASVKYNV